MLLAHAREETGAAIEREFERVMQLVTRDLSGYPALQRKLLDEITRVEEDYQHCNEVPPPPPNWIKAVETIAKIKDGGDGLIQKILEDIATSVDDIYGKILTEYRRSYEERHKILKGFMPFWRSLEQTLTRVDRNITGLGDSAARIDALMEKYREIQAGSERLAQTLTASAAAQFVIAGAVLVVALGGAFVNFWLIARPMAAMVGGGEYLAGGSRPRTSRRWSSFWSRRRWGSFSWSRSASPVSSRGCRTCPSACAAGCAGSRSRSC